MALDLSALDVFDNPAIAAQPAKPTGEPLELLLSDIDEDPDQPRKEFTAEAMEEMTASIRARGVKSPVSVRPHPTLPGRWMLNYGARRFRGSIAAGKTTIRAFVDATHDDYDQVIENLQRENLTPMELALFVKSRLGAGEKPSVIAKKLGKPAPAVAEYMALVDAPACVEEVYSTGKSRSPKTLYELRKLHDKYPEEVAEWCASAVEVTRRTVAELADLLSPKKKIEPKEQGQEPSARDPHATDGLNGKTAASQDAGNSDGAGDGKGQGGANVLPFHNPNHEKEKPETRLTDASKIKKPLLLVDYNKRSAMVLLYRRPTTPGLIWIKYEDNGDEIELDAGQVKLNCLTESQAQGRP